ncbi:MAG TPA: hypothetical protein VN792_06130, partial [Candidatus Acidoferrales bacterium]|nr:hypothetical protein [Candidatus Acidoferrales bacterium]
RIRSIEDGMLGMGHFTAAQAQVRCAANSDTAGDFDADHPEIHSALTAARAFRENSKAFVNLSIYEQRLTGPLYGASALHRSLKEALRQLKELQTERRERYKTEMDDAIRLLKTQEMKGLPFDPEEAAAQPSVRCADGIRFVYASAEIARESALRDRFDAAKLAEKAGFNLARYTAWRVPQHAKAA